ncbi:phage head spike fiber domain-containing protein, partial [Roseomonas xinghualingensis]|uniref:phage head spike fiber domain-containing protein n=1 Tax=Roseomonas xinghualingensis TaxID=2986475 RepID=UPI0036711241
MSDAPPLGYKPFSQAIAETPLGTILKEASVQATTAALAVAEAREEVASQVAAVASSEAAAASSAGLAASSAAAAAAAIPARARRAMGRPASTPAIIRVTRASARSVINIQRRFTEQAAQAGVLGALTWDFDPALGVPMGPIHEGRRQNLVADARTIGGTGWSRANMVVLGTTTGPDGVAGSATTLQETTANASHSTTTNISVTAGLPCTSAFILRPGPGVSTCQISYFATGFGLDAYANFDLGAGTVGTTGAAVTRAFIQPLGGGWWWIEMTAPCVSTVASQGMSLGMTLTPSAGRAPGYAGTGRTLDVWCNWIEQAPFASSPILPPMGAPGPRSARPTSGRWTRPSWGPTSTRPRARSSWISPAGQAHSRAVRPIGSGWSHWTTAPTTTSWAWH